MKTFVTLITLLLFTGLSAEDVGILKGKVTDSQTGEPLIGANILIIGTKLGAATELDGTYKIENVPVGTYSIKASYVGYNNFIKPKIKVAKNTTVIVDFQLSAGIQMEEITVVDNQYFEVRSTNSCKVVSGGVSEWYPTHNTEEYSKIDESGFLNVISKPLSTFAADIDGAAYSNARRFLNRDQLPYKDAVRVEEFINYFSYDYKKPEGEDPLSINLEYSDCPWNKKNKLVHIGLQGKTLTKEEQKPSNLVFLLDVSGSMNLPKKLPLLKKSFRLLVNQLNPTDRVAIVVYAGNAGLVLPSTSADEPGKILKALDQLQAGGSTAGGAGIQLAYKVAKQNFIKDGNNRVILATDGDFNVGISSTSELVRFIEEKRDDGIFLTVLGFGMGNYKDDRLQNLADKGNGNHAYIDNILEAKKVLVNEITSTLFTIAKDVKIQVEFNPAKVESYRLVGYENRKLEDKDFTDDKKDAGEIGAGHTVTALYEVVPANSNNNSSTGDLKYQQTTIKDGAYNSDEVLTVRIRYKQPDGDKSKEITTVLSEEIYSTKSTSNNFKFSAAVAEFAMLLRDSEFKGNSSYNGVLALAKSSVGEDKFGYRSEFLDLVEIASLLGDEKPQEAVLVD